MKDIIVNKNFITDWDKIIEELYNNNIIGYRILELDLSQPRTNQPYEIRGNFLQVLEIPNNPPKIEIIFNDIFEYSLPIKEKEQFVLPFRKFFISNDVGTGKLKLFIGKNVELTPYTKNFVNLNVDFSEIINYLANLQDLVSSLYAINGILRANLIAIQRNDFLFFNKTIQPYEIFTIQGMAKIFVINRSNNVLKIRRFGQQEPNQFNYLYPNESFFTINFSITSIEVINDNPTSSMIDYYRAESPAL